MQTRHTSIRLPLLGLLIVFLLPVLVSAYLYHYHQRFQFKTLNYGMLIRPAIPMQDLAVNDKHWQIVYVAKCNDPASDKMLFTLHQLQKALGKDLDRVNLTVVSNPTCPLKNPHDFRPVLLTPDHLAKLQERHIYLVDPISNVFMTYTADTNLMYVLKDLKKVLEVSQIG